MSGWARMGFFLLVQAVRKTIAAPLAGSRAGKCTGVFRCGGSFAFSEGHALSCPRCLSCPPRRVDFVTFICHNSSCFGHDEAWPSESTSHP